MKVQLTKSWVGGLGMRLAFASMSSPLACSMEEDVLSVIVMDWLFIRYLFLICVYS